MKPREDDGFSPIWPKGPASKWWLAVGFVGGILAVLAISLLMTLEHLA